MYAELHAKTNFTFLEGASHPDELVRRAAELGYAALAITDRNSLSGVVQAHVAAKEVGLKLLIGAEITPEDAPPVVLLAMDRTGYGRLSSLITEGRRRGEKGQCRLTFRDVAEAASGLIAGIREECKLQNANCKLKMRPRLRIHHSSFIIISPRSPRLPCCLRRPLLSLGRVVPRAG